MDFRFSEEQQMIRATAEAFLGEVSTSAAVRKAMATELGYDPQLWQRVCTEMYWQAMHIPEAYGGLGLGYVELVATLEQMGRYLLCAPFYATVCLAANALLVADDIDPEHDEKYSFVFNNWDRLKQIKLLQPPAKQPGALELLLVILQEPKYVLGIRGGFAIVTKKTLPPAFTIHPRMGFVDAQSQGFAVGGA